MSYSLSSLKRSMYPYYQFSENIVYINGNEFFCGPNFKSMYIMSFCDLLNPKFDISDIIYIDDTQGFNLYFFEKDPAFLEKHNLIFISKKINKKKELPFKT